MVTLPNGRWLWRNRLLLAVGLGFAAGTVMSQLQAILAGMHPPGGPAAGLSGLWGLWPSAGAARDLVDAWQAQADGPGFHSPEFVVWSFVFVDSLFFVVAYAIVLFAALSWLRGALSAAIALPPDENQEDARRRALLEAYLRLVRGARRLVPALIAADLFENALTLAVYYTAGTGSWYRWLVFPAFWTASTLKWLLAVLIVVPLIVGTLSLPVVKKERAAQVWRALLVARLQLLLLVVFGAAMFVSDQSADAFRRWRDEPWHGISAAVLTALFAFVLLVTTWRLFHLFCQDRDREPRNGRLAAAAAVAAGAGLGLRFWELGEGLFVLAGILFAIALLSALTSPSVTPARREREIGGAARSLPPLIAAVPLVLLGMAVLGAAVPEFAYSMRDWQWFAVLGLAGLLLQAAGWTLAVLGRGLLREHLEPNKDAPGWQNWFVFTALFMVLYVGWRVAWNPWRTTDVLGTHGVFVAAMIAAAFLAFFLAIVAEGYWPPRAFIVLRLNRTPVFVLLLAWVLGAAAVDQRGAYYDARLSDATARAQGVDRSKLGARAAFAEWERGLAPGADPAQMVFVAAAGGGIRAAYWVAAALTCVLEGDGKAVECGRGGRARGTPFAMSGISGGSLGLAAYIAHLRADERGDWFDERLDDDYAAPLVGWAVFVDAPLSVIRRDGGTDRAEVLERAWERSWIDRADDRSVGELLFGQAAGTDDSELAKRIFDLWAGGEHFPLLLLNGTKVQDGCRFNASVLALSVDGKDAGKDATTERLVEDCLALRLFEQDQPFYVPPQTSDPDGVRRDEWMLASTDDLSDFLCADQDVRLSTAVLLSARFPWIAPSGRIEKCGRDHAINLVDGGYFDTSGASPLVELSSELEQQVEEHNATPGNRCIVPVYIQIDTGYADPARAAGRRPP
ncbi:MAG: patatin-like phospholipase family protein [Gaiellaceae bacterium]